MLFDIDDVRMSALEQIQPGTPNRQKEMAKNRLIFGPSHPCFEYTLHCKVEGGLRSHTSS